MATWIIWRSFERLVLSQWQVIIWTVSIKSLVLLGPPSAMMIESCSFRTIILRHDHFHHHVILGAYPTDSAPTLTRPLARPLLLFWNVRWAWMLNAKLRTFFSARWPWTKQDVFDGLSLINSPIWTALCIAKATWGISSREEIYTRQWVVLSPKALEQYASYEIAQYFLERCDIHWEPPIYEHLFGQVFAVDMTVHLNSCKQNMLFI